MIQEYLMNELKVVIPDLTWSMDYRWASDNTGTVYSESGGQINVNDETVTRYPSYMVYIRSSKWGYAETAAHEVWRTLNGMKDFDVTVNQYDANENVVGQLTYHVFYVGAVAEPNRIGVKDGVMEYSVNIDVTLTL